MEREKERELELESAMYSNCLLLGLDPAIIGLGSNTDSPRVGRFRHSNPKLGDQLLHFIISSMRGPIQSAKGRLNDGVFQDFDKVLPFFDPGFRSRDFHKAVQNIISHLEYQGALPRNNSSVSSLATCCGPRFVELLWQLSSHALREVYRQMFPDDFESNPLPPPLTDVAFSQAASLLNVTKAKIALERRKFLERAESTVHEQNMWINLAHEMTSEFRSLSAEEAYLQKELEKIDDSRNNVMFEDESQEDYVSCSNENISKATRLWESLLAQSSQHEVLASGPIADLITHRDHRYRISGPSLLSAMDHSFQPGDMTSADSLRLQANDEFLSRVDGRNVRSNQPVDISEILRRWTHALQRISKQSLYLEKCNDGEGPELLRSSHVGIGHAESMANTLSEHQGHLASTQVLNDRMMAYISSLEESISEHTEEVNFVSSHFPEMNKHYLRQTSPGNTQSSEKALESDTDEVGNLSSKMSSVQIDKASSPPSILKLPQLFAVTPKFNGKERNLQKEHSSASPPNQKIKNVFERKSRNQPHSTNPIQVGRAPPSYAQNVKRSVRETAVGRECWNSESSRENGQEHFFVPISSMKTYSPEVDVFEERESQSPPILTEPLNLADSYEDLLAPLTDSEKALMQF